MRNREVYSGGSARGAVQVYPAERLQHLHGFDDVEAHGGSTGAITAAGRASGRLHIVRGLYMRMKSARLFQRRQLDVWRGLYSLAPLHRIIRANIHPRDFRMPAYAHVVDLATGAYEAIALHELTTAGDLADAIVCSCSQTGIHEIEWFRGRPKGDAGIYHVTPRITAKGATTITYVSAARLTDLDAALECRIEDVGITRALALVVAQNKRNDYARMRRQANAYRDTCTITLVEPQRDPGDPFDARQPINLGRLTVIGPEAWAHRRVL